MPLRARLTAPVLLVACAVQGRGGLASGRHMLSDATESTNRHTDSLSALLTSVAYVVIAVSVLLLILCGSALVKVPLPGCCRYALPYSDAASCFGTPCCACFNMRQANALLILVWNVLLLCQMALGFHASFLYPYIAFSMLHGLTIVVVHIMVRSYRRHLAAAGPNNSGQMTRVALGGVSPPGAGATVSLAMSPPPPPPSIHTLSAELVMVLQPDYSFCCSVDRDIERFSNSGFRGPQRRCSSIEQQAGSGGDDVTATGLEDPVNAAAGVPPRRSGAWAPRVSPWRAVKGVAWALLYTRKDSPESPLASPVASPSKDPPPPPPPPASQPSQSEVEMRDRSHDDSGEPSTASAGTASVIDEGTGPRGDAAGSSQGGLTELSGRWERGGRNACPVRRASRALTAPLEAAALELAESVAAEAASGGTLGGSVVAATCTRTWSDGLAPMYGDDRRRTDAAAAATAATAGAADGNAGLIMSPFVTLTHSHRSAAYPRSNTLTRRNCPRTEPLSVSPLRPSCRGAPDAPGISGLGVPYGGASTTSVPYIGVLPPYLPRGGSPPPGLPRGGTPPPLPFGEHPAVALPHAHSFPLLAYNAAPHSTPSGGAPYVMPLNEIVMVREQGPLHGAGGGASTSSLPCCDSSRGWPRPPSPHDNLQPEPGAPSADSPTMPSTGPVVLPPIMPDIMLQPQWPLHAAALAGRIGP